MFNFVSAVLLFLSTNAFAGREPEKWDSLPAIKNIFFTIEKVGLKSDKEYFWVNKSNGKLNKIDERNFNQTFKTDRKHLDPIRSMGYANERGSRDIPNQRVKLFASNGNWYQASNPNCSEGNDAYHILKTRDERIINDHLEKCMSIVSIEEIGDQLWIGTEESGEYGDYPGMGITILNLKLRKVLKTLSTDSGLPGNYIRVIRADPFTKNIWISTEFGPAEISPTFKVIRSFYFYKDFDPKTSRPTWLVSRQPMPGNGLATLAEWFKILAIRNFREQGKKIPEITRAIWTSDKIEHLSFTLGNEFLPREYNVLVPAIIFAYKDLPRREKRKATTDLCLFNDPEILAFVKTLDFPMKETCIRNMGSTKQ